LKDGGGAGAWYDGTGTGYEGGAGIGTGYEGGAGMGYEGGAGMGTDDRFLMSRSMFDDEEPPSDFRRLGAMLKRDADGKPDEDRRPSNFAMFDDEPDEETPRPARLSYRREMFACLGPRFTMCFRVALATVFDERFFHMFAMPFMIFPIICCFVARFALLYT
jgi:hypothetical protein